MTHWHMLTGEYPPQPGGVSDYTRLVARELAKDGESSVHIWTSPCSGETPRDAGVEVHRLPDHFGPRSLRALQRSLNSAERPAKILVQYVPHAFGWKALNVPFCLWLWSRRRRESIWVMFHEVHFPLNRNQSAAHNLLGATTRLMASIVARAAERIFVSIPAWGEILSSLKSTRAPIIWMPVPSTMPVIEDANGVAALRAHYAPSDAVQIIGHFGTYAPHITKLLKPLLPLLLLKHAERRALLMGRDGEALRDELVYLYPQLQGRVYATGSLSADDISRHLSACDVMVQPFGDGVSCRRTSVMTALAHGRPVVTTSGPLTESLWAESGAVMLAPVADANAQAEATELLLSDAERSTALGLVAAKLYRERFDVRHTIAILNGAQWPTES